MEPDDTVWYPMMEPNPNRGARIFALAHYKAGHRYTITGIGTDDMHVTCECGMESRKDGVDFPQPLTPP